jgi:LysM repeat protein
MPRYDIQEGDSIVSIAQAHGISVHELIQRNPDLLDGIQPGDRIRVPKVNPDNPPGPVKEPTPGEIIAEDVGGNMDDPNNPNAAGDEDGSGQNGIQWQDPEFLAFMRQMGVETAMIRDARRTFIDRMQARLNPGSMQQTQYDTRIQDLVDNTNASYAGRGMYFSGGRGRDITQGTADINNERNIWEGGIREDMQDARKEAALQIAEWQRRRAEERLAARERQTALDLEMATGQA